ncbi:MAG: serine hydrolase [Acidimicrobiales bacterium]|nr:serine hydrolase [Acidimicrobiales bacterium]
MTGKVSALFAALAVLAALVGACSSPTQDESAPVTTAADTTPSDTTPSDVAPVFDFSAVDPIVGAYVEDQGLDGAGLVVVHRDHGVVHHQHWGQFDEDRVSLVASSTKMVTATVLLNLQDRGLLDIDAPVAEQTGWEPTGYAITPAQLLSNSSGLIGLVEGLLFPAYLCQFRTDGTLSECGRQIFTTEADDSDVVAPDTEFRYGGGQWQVAGAVAEVVSGQPWNELVDEVVFGPCGLESTGYNNHFGQFAPGFGYPGRFDGDPSVLEPTDNPNMEGGMYTTTGDYAQLLLMQLRDGMCGDTRVLSPESLELMHSDRIARQYDGSAAPGLGYGLGWWVDRDSGIVSDPGAYGSVPWLDLDDGYGAFLVIEDSGPVGQRLAELLQDPVDEAIAAALD